MNYHQEGNKRFIFEFFFLFLFKLIIKFSRVLWVVNISNTTSNVVGFPQ